MVMVVRLTISTITNLESNLEGVINAVLVIYGWKKQLLLSVGDKYLFI